MNLDRTTALVTNLTTRISALSFRAVSGENLSLEFRTRSDTNGAVLQQKMARCFSFHLESRGIVLYYLCSKNKGADHLGGYRAADRCYCFCIWLMQVFS